MLAVTGIPLPMLPMLRLDLADGRVCHLAYCRHPPDVFSCFFGRSCGPLYHESLK